MTDDSTQGTGETPTYDVCKFYVKDRSCRFDSKCRNAHGVITISSNVKAHDAPIKSLNVLSVGDVPRLLSASTDSTIKVCNKLELLNKGLS